MGAASLCVLVALITHARSPACTCGALSLAILLTGIAAARRQAFYYPANHITHFTTDARRLAQIELKIDQPPRILTASAPSYLPPRQATQGSALRVLAVDGSWLSVSGRILLHLDEPHDQLAVGQTVRALGYLHRPSPAMNPGEFDWADYYRDQRILTAITVPHRGNVQVLSDPGPSLHQRLRITAREALAKGFTDAQALDHALLRALVLGDSDPQLNDVQDQFLRTGTSHHLAISGMHVAILGFFVYGICRLCFLSPFTSAITGMAVVLLYSLVVLPSPPVLRSAFLCLALGLGILLKRSIDPVQLLALSISILLAIQPLDLYRPGFQLSFGTVLGLMLFTRPAVAWIDSWRDAHAVIADSFRKPTAWQRRRRWLGRKLLEASVACLVAWAVATPLVLYHFNQLNPWAALASLILAVPVAAALFLGVLKIVLTLLFPFMAGALATAAAWPVLVMRKMVDWLEALPGGDVPLPQPPLWTLVLFYALLALLLLPLARAWLKHSCRFACVAAWALPLTLPWLSLPGAAPQPGTLRLTLLSVGAGQCAVVHTPSGKVLLFDAGASPGKDLVRRTLAPYLKQMGRWRATALYISHANADHFNAAAAAVERLGIGEVYLTPYFAPHAAEHPDAMALLDAVAGEQAIAAGHRVAVDEHTALEVLWPPPGLPLLPNDSSMVLRLTCHGRSILITGDIQEVAQRSLLRDPDRLKCDVLIAPHHGSTETTTRSFLGACSPQYALSSNDATLSQKQRKLEELIADIGAPPPLRTHERGAVMVDVAPDAGITTRTFRSGR